MLKTRVNYNKVFTLGWNIDGAEYNTKYISISWISNSEYFLNFYIKYAWTKLGCDGWLNKWDVKN